GGWAGSVIEPILPVELLPDGNDFESGELVVQPALTGSLHALWHIMADEKQNRDILQSFPPFQAGNRFARAKPNLTTVLATSPSSRGGNPLPLLTVGRYSKGRSMALA